MTQIKKPCKGLFDLGRNLGARLLKILGALLLN